MAQKLEELYVEVKVKTDKMQKDLNGLKSKTASTAKSMGSSFSSMKGKVLAAAAAIAVVLAVVGKAVKAAKEQAIAEALVAQAVKRTGEAAGYSAKQLFKMASELQKITGVGDEKILQNITNQLLTFGKIGGDVFKRAQLAVLDLNAVIAKGEVGALTSQSIQLGKALNDPIAGISALSRVGIAFTKQQKEQIKVFVDAGKIFEAQTLILDELENQYGGQAEALNKATGGAKGFEAAFGDLLERLGDPILSALTPIFSGLNAILELVSSSTGELVNNETEAIIKSNELGRSFDTLSGRYLQLKGAGELTEAQTQVYNGTIAELQKQFPNYLKNVDLQNISFNEATIAIGNARGELEKYTQSIIAAAVIKDLEEEIGTLGKQLYNSEQAISDAKVALDKFNQTGVDPVSGLKTTDNQNFADAVRKQLESASIIFEGQGDALTEKLKSFTDKLKQAKDTFAEALAPTTAPSGGGGGTPLTPDQLKLLEETTGKLQKYRDEIALLNTELLKVPKGSEAYKLIEAAIGELQTKLKAEKIKIGLEFPDSEATAYLSDFDAKNKEAQDKILAQESAYNQNRIAEVDAYYNYVRGADEGYYAYKLAQIQADADAYLLATNDKLQADILYNELKADLDAETAATAQATINAQMQGLGALGNALGQAAGLFAENTAAYKIMASTQASISTYLAATNALAQLPIPFNFIAAALVTAAGLANVGKILSAHDGGTFGGGRKIASFAGGGTATVPLGYPGDSFPVLVQSGEQLSVTPANQVGETEKLLGTLIGSVNALNLNLLNKNMSAVSNISIDAKSITKAIYSTQNKMEREGTDLDLL